MKYQPRRARARPAFKRDPEGGEAVIRGRYRYSLTRWWEPEPGREPARVAWIMLNPSTANASIDDPTIRRVRAFSRDWGYNTVEVVNLFAYRTPSPEHLWERTCDIEGSQNRDYLRAAILSADRVVAAWGAAENDRVTQAIVGLKAALASAPPARRPWCLGTTANGGPKHPLYLKADTPVVKWPETDAPARSLAELVATVEPRKAI